VPVHARGLAELYFAKFPHDSSLVRDEIAPDFRFHHLVEVEGATAFAAFMAGVSRAFPDFSFRVHHLVAEGEFVFAHYDFSGIQADTFLDTVPSLGRPFSVRGMSLFRCGNRIEELWVAFDSLSMMKQLGAVPP
jgi:predicted ester cyclase